MGLRQKAVQGVVWSVIENWGRQAISFVVFFLLARLLGPEAFGLVALATVFLAFVGVFLDQGFSQAIVQRQEVEPEHLDTAFWTNIGVSTLLTVLCIASADWVASLFKEPDLAPIVCWLSLNFILLAFSSVQQALFQRKLAFKTLALRSLVAIVVSGTVGVAMAFMGFGVWSLVGQQLSSSLTQALVLWGTSDWRPGFRVSARHFRELFSFGISIVGFAFVNFFNRRADDFIIGYFLGPVALGYYSVAYKLLLVMIELLTRIVDKVAVPTFSRLQTEPERLRKAFIKIIKLTNLITFPCFIGVSLLSAELIPILFGDQWRSSIPVMRILAFVGIIQSTYIFKSSVILAMGKPTWRLGIGILNSTVSVIGFCIGVRWGIEAVAISYIITNYLFSPVSVLAVQKLINIKISDYYGQYTAPLIASAIMAISIIGVRILASSLESYLLLLVSMLVGALVYVLAIYILFPSTYQQVFQFTSQFGLKKK